MFPKLSAAITASILAAMAAAQASDARWRLDEGGGIAWQVDPVGPSHHDFLEMSGRQVSLILHYGVNGEGNLEVERRIVWPMLRTIPNDTHASLLYTYTNRVQPEIMVDGRLVEDEKPVCLRLDGMLHVASLTECGLEIQRAIFPSTMKPVVVENFRLTNTTDHAQVVEVGFRPKTRRTSPDRGVYGRYILEARMAGEEAITLMPGESAAFSLIFSGRKETDSPITVDPIEEQAARRAFVDSLWSKLHFECPEPVLSRAFAFAKLRASESIFATRGGLMHGPGGERYYAAIWANDQAEYANPFFPYLGDEGGNESALNAFRHFARFMNDAYTPIPSSIIAEGTDIWDGAGDRGDAAMIAYGAARFALASGNRDWAEQLWPLITWCLEYCHRKANDDGVIASDSDELEGRFPAGDANLCTSSLCYDGLVSAAMLVDALDKEPALAVTYRERAQELREAIEHHFGATVQGFDTYRYYAGNEVLRAWICIPLTMGIFERRQGTIDALFSPRLWTKDGLATESGQETFWDRATLYGVRGVFHAGATERALPFFRNYSTRRLLGEHVPYPVEAWPEGNQRHLAAESALYCRVVTEGLFGMRPSGLHAFICKPSLPEAWPAMALRDVRAHGRAFDLEVTREETGISVRVVIDGQEVAREMAGEDGKVAIQLP